MRRTKEPAAGQPAARHLCRLLASEQDREIVRRIDSGESRSTIGRDLRMSVIRVKLAEKRVETEAKARELLSADPESLEGLYLLGELSGRSYHAFGWHPNDWEGPEIKRLSDVAALGRLHWCCAFPHHGPKSVELIDRLLERAGIEWASDNCAPKRKEREPVQPQQDRRSQFWNDIVHRVAEIERALGTAILENCQGRDSVEGVSYRLAFLTGYIESRAERERKTIDITPDDQDDADREDLETAGNLICLPGVKLADVLVDGGAS